MRDTLDLKRLATEIEAIQKRDSQTQSIRVIILSVFMLLFLLLFFAIMNALQSGNIRFIEQVIFLSQMMVLGYLIYLLTMTLVYYRIRHHAARHAAPVIERLTPMLGFPLNLREALPVSWLLTITIVAVAVIVPLVSDVQAFWTVGFLVIVALHRYFWPRIQTVWIYWGPFALADYSNAIKRTDLLCHFNRIGPLPHYSKAYISRAAGQLDQVEAIAIEGLRRTQHSVNTTYWCSAHLELLAHLWMERGEFEKAIQLLEAALWINPTEVSYSAALAALYLTPDDNLERAMELIDFSVSRMPTPPKHNFTLQRSSQAIVKLLETQVCWLSGQVERGNAAVELALQLIDPRHKPLTATAYVSLSNLWQMQGDTTKARNYCQKALTLDPTGLSGYRARKLLNQLETGNR